MNIKLSQDIIDLLRQKVNFQTTMKEIKSPGTNDLKWTFYCNKPKKRCFSHFTFKLGDIIDQTISGVISVPNTEKEFYEVQTLMNQWIVLPFVKYLPENTNYFHTGGSIKDCIETEPIE